MRDARGFDIQPLNDAFLDCMVFCAFPSFGSRSEVDWPELGSYKLAVENDGSCMHFLLKYFGSVQAESQPRAIDFRFFFDREERGSQARLGDS